MKIKAAVVSSTITQNRFGLKEFDENYSRNIAFVFGWRTNGYLIWACQQCFNFPLKDPFGAQMPVSFQDHVNIDLTKPRALVNGNRWKQTDSFRCRHHKRETCRPTGDIHLFDKTKNFPSKIFPHF